MNLFNKDPFLSWLAMGLIIPCDLHFAQHMAPEQAAFFAYLIASAREGHLCVSVKKDQIEPSWGEWDPLLIKQAAEVSHEALVRHGSFIYLKRNYEIEKEFLHHLKRLRQSAPSLAYLKPHIALLPLNQEQKAVIEKACMQTVTWVSGGPGTGKTHTAACFIQLFLESNSRKDGVVVVAPTGKAAANLRRKITHEAITVQTLHAVLARRQVIGADLIIIDEGSMVDAMTYAQFFSKIKTGAHVVVFGDKYQLPPVSSGNFFADCAFIECCELKECLRTQLREILELAEAVKQGKLFPVSALTHVEKKDEIMILTPLRQGPYGVESLNRRFLDPKASQKPIMIVQNCPELGVYNGDLGLLEGPTALFEGRRIPTVQLPRYEWAYVLSVHKSQGSEYDHVHILLPEGSERFGREMLYTAITRARKSVKIEAAEGILEKVLKHSDKRLSGLQEA